MVVYLIISVHRTASWSSISLSLYWFLSISTRAISTLVKRFLCAVGTSFCAIKPTHRHCEVHVMDWGVSDVLRVTRNPCCMCCARIMSGTCLQSGTLSKYSHLLHLCLCFSLPPPRDGLWKKTLYCLFAVFCWFFSRFVFFFLAIHNEGKQLTRAGC